MAANPLRAAEAMPTTNGIAVPAGSPPLAISRALYAAAPPITGMLRRKEYLAADSRSSRTARPVTMVIPERDTPGQRAKACATPMRMASVQVRASRSRSRRARWSTAYMIRAKTIIMMAMIHGLPSRSSMKLSRATPRMAAGIVLTMRSQAKRASGSARLRLVMLRAQALSSRPISRQK